jgi:hypothetical protein
VGGEVVRHRTLEGYATELRLAGFELVELSEARPGPDGPAADLPSGLVLRCRRAGVSV